MNTEFYNRDDQGNLQVGNTTYNAQNEASNTTVDAAGNVKTMTNAAGDPTTVIYDAWGRPVRYSATHVSHDSDGNTTTTTVSTQSVQYDALGRELSTFESTSGAVTDQVQSIMLYNAQNQVIEVRNSPTATHPYEQYVYSGDGSGRMVLRDRDAAGANNGILNERLYVLQLPDGSTSALANTAGVVVERYVYDPLGNVQALQADGTAYAAYTMGTVSTADGDLGQYYAGATFSSSGLSGLTPTNTAGGTQYAWNNFYQGQRYERIAGIYDTASGPRNPRTDSLLKPDYAALAAGRNAYDPAAGGSWFDHHAGQVAQGCMIGIGVAITLARQGWGQVLAWALWWARGWVPAAGRSSSTNASTCCNCPMAAPAPWPITIWPATRQRSNRPHQSCAPRVHSRDCGNSCYSTALTKPQDARDNVALYSALRKIMPAGFYC